MASRRQDPEAGDRDRESCDPEADKLQMEYFKHIGTLSLAAAVLMVTLFGAFGRSDTPHPFLFGAVIGAVFAFTVSLLLSSIGTYAIVEHWGTGNVFRFSRKRSRDKFIHGLRLFTGLMFINGVIGFFLFAFAISKVMPP